VLALTVTMLKNKYMLLKLKNYAFIYFLPDLAICFCSRSTSMFALLFSLPTYKERSCYHPVCFIHKVGGKNVIIPDFLVNMYSTAIKQEFFVS
jgi:hypothetical protein